jgi:hypothetical protein
LDAPTRADALIREGVELRREGRENEALERFRSAHAIHPSPRALGQMGLAAKSSRLYVDAERYLQQALAAAADPWIVQNQPALEQALEIVGRQLASLAVTCNVAGAELLVNGATVATLPLERPVRVLAGAARVEVRAAGHVAATREAALEAGSTVELALELAPAAPSEPATAPPPVVPERSTPLVPRPEPDAPVSRRPWIIAAAAVGVVGVGAGASLGIVTLNKKAERDELCPPTVQTEFCPSERGVELDGEARTTALWSTVGFAAGIAGLGAAAVLFWLEPDGKLAAPTGRVTAGVTPRGGFVAANVAF